GIVHTVCARVGGDTFDEAIARFVKQRYNVLIGERTAEAVKRAIGTAVPVPGDAREHEVRGRDLVTGLPRTLRLTPAEIHEALEEPLLNVIAAIRSALERVPPELAADVLARGVVL